jgi:elongation factor 3
VTKVKRVINKLTGERRYEYEAMFDGCSMDQNQHLSDSKLGALGWAKHMKIVDAKVEVQYARPLTQESIETHIENVGLSREFASHYRMSAAMWMQPHILILDEPTNFLGPRVAGRHGRGDRGV